MARFVRASVVVVLAALLSVVSFRGDAQAVPVPSYSHTGSPAPTIQADGNPYTLGYEFTTTQTWEISAFGYNANTQFTGTHGVALFRVSDQALLGTANVTVLGGNSNLTDFVYTNLSTPIVIPAGTYRIGGATLGQGYVYQSGLSGIISAPGNSYIAGYYAAGFPTYPNIANVNWLTTNFLFAEVTVPSAPEPSSLAMFGLGIVGLPLARKRAKNSRASN